MRATRGGVGGGRASGRVRVRTAAHTLADHARQVTRQVTPATCVLPWPKDHPACDAWRPGRLALPFDRTTRPPPFPAMLPGRLAPAGTP